MLRYVILPAFCVFALILAGCAEAKPEGAGDAVDAVQAVAALDTQTADATTAATEASAELPPCCLLPEDDATATATTDMAACCEGDDACDHADGEACDMPCCQKTDEAVDAAGGEPMLNEADPSVKQMAAGVGLINAATSNAAQQESDAKKAAEKATEAEDLTPANALEATVEAREWIEVGDRSAFDFDYVITTQAGEEKKLSALVGKPMAMSFMFTNCSNPAMCPMVTVNMANLQRVLEKRGLTDSVQLVLLSYDPVRDTPAALKKYGEARGVRFNNLAMVRPHIDTYRDLISEINITVMPMSDGDINHGIELLLIDAQGRYVRDYFGGHWNNDDVANDLQRLVDEAKQAKAVETTEAAAAPAGS